MIFILAIFLKLIVYSSAEQKVYHVSLNQFNKSNLFWSLDYKTQTVKFEVEVKIDKFSWFAVGFSNYGEFTGADLCTFWVDWRKHVHFQDTWINSKSIVEIDESQDCKEFKYRYNKNKDSLLRFIFYRQFDTCDPQDYIIEDGTTHIVWIIGNGPLYQIDGINILQLATDMGFQRVRLLQTDELPPEHPADTFTLDILANSVKVPNVETTYWCRTYRLPSKLLYKHHIIQYESVINEKSNSVVHHMEVFHCEAAANKKISDYEGPCEGPNRPNDTKACKRVLAAWAMGAPPFAYPEEAGLPIGGNDFNLYVMLEIHYHNPELLTGLVDSSGIRLYVTKTLRKYDGGVMELGLEYTDKMAIPPRQTKFSLSGYCIKECTAVSIPENGIVVFASQLHTHLTGKKVFTKHVRNGFELKELNRDNHYSQHFQEIRKLKYPVKILPGDALITTCEYDTSFRENITLGGFSISDEMCVNYIHYYPKTNLEVCKSSISNKDLSEYFHFMSKWENQKTLTTHAISERYGNIEWTPLRVEGLKKVYQNSYLSMQCNTSSGTRFPGKWEGAHPTRIKVSYIQPKRNCPDFY